MPGDTFAANHDRDLPDPANAAGIIAQITGCQSALYAYVCSLLGTSAGAADVLQEANLVLWQKAGEYDRARPFLPWAYKIAWFQVLAHRKRLSRDRLVFDDALLATVDETFRRQGEDESDAKRQLQALDGCIVKLPPKHREIVESRYQRGEAVNDIAARLGQAPNSVAAQLYRIRKALTDCILARLAAAGES